MEILEINETVRFAVQSDLANTEHTHLSIDDRANKLFHSLKLDSGWHRLLDAITLGWYDSSRKNIIQQPITEEFSTHKYTVFYY